MPLDKTGFSYYCVNSDKYSDIRMKRLKSKFSFEGLVLYDYLLSEIFRVKGCYLEWNEDVAFLAGEELGIDEEKVHEIILFCCELKLFDKYLLTQEKVLSSTSIQQRYVEMCKINKRRTINIPKKINILPPENEKDGEEAQYGRRNENETKEVTPVIQSKEDKPYFLNNKRNISYL